MWLKKRGSMLRTKSRTVAQFQSGFIADLHTVTDYSANGLFGPVNFSLSDFGKVPKKLCEYLVKLKGDAYGHPTQVCGAILPNSDQLPSA